jgi:hypothetical protein
MTDYGLSSQQLAVICSLSSGATMTAAAEASQIHRNTIASWRRNCLPFQHAFAHAQYDRALYYREKLEELAGLAIQNLQAILTDPDASAAVRLKAALAVIQAVTTPPAPKKRVELDIEKVVIKRDPPQTVNTNLEKVHNPAQSTPPEAAPPAAPPDAPPVHNSAQTPYRRESPKVGRNQPCPAPTIGPFTSCQNGGDT